MTIIFRRTTFSEQVGCVLIQYRLDLFILFILFILVPTLEGRERMKKQRNFQRMPKCWEPGKYVGNIT